MKPWIIAHRGAASVAPENTMAAFRAAVELGASAVELDVQQSLDGELVVMHDDTVERTTDGGGLVGELSLAELQALDAGSWFSAEFAGEQVPLLREVLALPVVPVIELKYGSERYPGIEERLVQVLTEADRVEDAVVISGDPLPLARLRGAGIRTLSFREGTLGPDFDFSGQPSLAVMFAPPVPGLEAVIQRARKAGHLVIGTTLWVKAPLEGYLLRQIEAGLSGVFTDHVEVVRELIAGV